jgi:GT2 family glycosyltransferase
MTEQELNVRNFHKNIKVSVINEGFCRGNNIGLQHSRGDFIALLNNDTLVDMNWLEELYRAMTKHSHVGICASCIVSFIC